MSFAGGPGHRSPFTERAKASKSHLSPRRSSATASGPRGAQQSLFQKESSAFGGKVGDSCAKVSQSRNGPQADVIKEPTTPTRASEGKGNRRDEFSSFNNRRIGTPVKTPRTAFGTITPRSPKRPYMGSPKYQKVLVERPAFYNTPVAAGETSSTDSGKKAVSISELQKRLKRFLQDENIPARATSDNLDEVPGNISRSPRVNPLFHHDDTVLQVAKGGVAFTAGLDFAREEESSCTHSSKENADFHIAKGGVAFTAGEPFTVTDDVTAPEATPLAPQLEDERNESSLETERALSPEDFPVHSEIEDGSQAGEVCDEPAVGDSEEIPAQQTTSAIVELPIEEAGALEIVEEEAEEVHVEAEEDSVGEEAAPEIVEKKAEEVDVEAEENIVDAKAETECSVEEEIEEEYEIFESWSQRFLKFVVLAIMVACMMGFMVLASGSQGLLPKNLVAGPFSGSFVTPSVIPVSVGFMGLGREHEGIPCLPSVHLGLELLSSPSKNDAPQLESVSSYQPIVHNVIDLDELKTATSYYKELQGRLFSDVAGLTSESAETDGASLEETAAVVEIIEDVSAFEDVAEDVSASEDFAEVAAIEEVMSSEDVAESQVTMEVISGLVVDEAAPEQTLWYSDECDASEDNLVLESINVILDAAAGPDTDVELPADVESDLLTVEIDAVPTSEFVPSETTEILAFDFQPAEATPSVEEPSVEELTTEDISDEVVVLPNAPSITGDIVREDHTIGSSVENLVHDNVEEHLIEEPQSGGAVSIEEHVEPLSEATCVSPVSEVAEHEELILEEFGAKGSLPLATICLFVVTLASAVALKVSMRKSPAAATQVNLFPGTADTLKDMGSPVAWPSSRSVFDSHIPDRDELDAITSPLKGIRAPKRYGMDSFYGSAEPALSAPGVFKAPSARAVVQKPAMTWHPAMNAGGSTISSSWRQTASYVPSIPSQSGLSNSTRGASEADSVCESALTMGAEEWEHLGSFTTTELVSVVTEGGEEQKVRTPVRRSQRIRNRVSPLPERYNDYL